jgi:hypothetical protein
MALLLCLPIIACDDTGSGQTTGASTSGTAGNGGSAGAGNTGGNGSGGEGGGSSIPTCSTDQTTLALMSWPWFGFEQALPDPMPDLPKGAAAMVSAVELGGLRLTFDGATSDVRLAWSGPDLNQVFAAGDAVTVNTDAGLQDYRVTGAKGQAVVYRFANAQVPTMIPAVPGNGPNLALELECVHDQPKMCPLPERRTLYGLTATLGAETTKIPSGMTGQVGTWQIKHIKSMNTDFFNGMECTPDSFFDGTVHALEVKP